MKYIILFFALTISILMMAIILLLFLEGIKFYLFLCIGGFLMVLWGVNKIVKQ